MQQNDHPLVTGKINIVLSTYSIFFGFVMALGGTIMLLSNSFQIQFDESPVQTIWSCVLSYATALFLMISAVFSLKKRIWAKILNYLSLGMLFYAILDMNGHLLQSNDILTLIIYDVFLIAGIFLVFLSLLLLMRGRR